MSSLLNLVFWAVVLVAIFAGGSFTGVSSLLSGLLGGLSI